ncbi:small G protein signaling modulator 3 homolog [Pollicipes pollicipes]|uniref:small G protein signaling modulator 3 homolog n=1 Tax=Pollicipes pollicipes TaxID=41117 RepID=UPI00188563C9|nr:small G protein signaling modulator 3 homolog [Pollicipes pollicipes]
MRPRSLLERLRGAEPPDYRIDEFGFRVEEEDGPEQSSSKLLSTPFAESPKHRLQWIAHLEFSHSSETAPLSWEHMPPVLPRTDKLRAMVRRGVPHSLRPQIWLRMSGALQKKLQSDMTYAEMVKVSACEALMCNRQIEKDLLRTMPSNVCFSHLNSPGVPRLRRVLRALAWLYPDIGYCQGMGVIVASLLLFLEEEDVFWLTSAVVEDLLPASYYSSTLIGIQADQRVLSALIATYLPDLNALLEQHDIELSLITLNWFLTVFASVLHVRILLRVWDLFFYHGAIVIFQVALGMLRMRESELCKLDNSADIFNALSDIPGTIDDVEALLEVSFHVSSSLTEVVVESHRRRHLALVMTDQGALSGSPSRSVSLPKQQVNRRQMRRSKSMISVILFGDETSADDAKTKNVRQTEILVDLRESIQQLGQHFQSVDPELGQVSLVPDYSMESHAHDHDAFVSVSSKKQRRAKALLDFERHDDDELGFRKNDVITVLSMRDEHCWVGELNGLRGWFPAKFVDLLDERSKLYSSAGDDSVTEGVTHLVRGSLCATLKQILEHGMRRPMILGSVCHPWLFIEEVAHKEVERDYNSVYSRLVLCKTYRLDEDGKVLSPEELLYRCVEAVNLTHDRMHAQMDVKLRSLICLGLNEQVLHLWLEAICSNAAVVQKWYHPWSFISSPGWVQVKCELRVLAQFSFRLNPDWELPAKKNRQQPLREGVQDMLVKHHLFSWDL